MESKELTPGQVVGENAKALREARLYSRVELAELAGISHPSIVRLEEGNTPHPRRGTVQKVADALGVPIERLLEGMRDAPKAAASRPDVKERRLLRVHLESEEGRQGINRLFELRRDGEISPQEYIERLFDLFDRLEARAERHEASLDAG